MNSGDAIKAYKAVGWRRVSSRTSVGLSVRIDATLVCYSSPTDQTTNPSKLVDLPATPSPEK